MMDLTDNITNDLHVVMTNFMLAILSYHNSPLLLGLWLYETQIGDANIGVF